MTGRTGQVAWSGHPHAGPEEVQRHRPRFDPAEGPDGEEFVLPVDIPDEEHAVSAAMSNAIAFTTKVRGAEVLSIAFRCVGVSEQA